MIPKIIHFIWFGRGEYNARIKDCIDSWHRYLPDYEFNGSIYNRLLLNIL